MASLTFHVGDAQAPVALIYIPLPSLDRCIPVSFLFLPFITDCFFLVNMAGRPGYNMNSSGERNLLRKPIILAYVRYPGISCQEDYAGS